jgi:hypothetical protein
MPTTSLLRKMIFPAAASAEKEAIKAYEKDIESIDA